MVRKEDFERDLEGKQVELIHLKNASGTEVFITNYGARIISLQVLGNSGSPVETVVGYNTLNDYLTTEEIYHGATIGRYGNRIANGILIIDGRKYELEKNNGPNHLHGGTNGFHNRVWQIVKKSDLAVTLALESNDGDANYPGNLNVLLSYELSDGNEVIISYEAVTDVKTVVNLTNHSYFNLNGTGSILDHMLFINADRYTPVDDTLIPTGELASVDGTPFDFKLAKKIGERINDPHEQIKIGGGYDHNFVLNTTGTMTQAAIVTGDRSGIRMEVITDQPGVQFYSRNVTPELLPDGSSNPLFRTAFCLETQHFPDSPNQPSFPTTELLPGDVFRSRTIYKFSNV